MNYDGNTNAFLKISPKTNAYRLIHEGNIFKWINGRLPVPKVLFISENERFDFMLLSEITGNVSYSDKFRSKSRLIMEGLANGLKAIHSMDILSCPFDESVSNKLRAVEYNIDNGFVDKSRFESENWGMTVEELHSILLDSVPDKEDLVFTHGDFCMPNILFKRFTLSGFIDMGRAGIADRYQDIALMLRSLIYNRFSENDINRFLITYGIKELDDSKLRFYRMMDEFF
jgi:aminoglycoside phosphotransferase